MPECFAYRLHGCWPLLGGILSGRPISESLFARADSRVGSDGLTGIAIDL